VRALPALPVGSAFSSIETLRITLTVPQRMCVSLSEGDERFMPEISTRGAQYAFRGKVAGLAAVSALLLLAAALSYWALVRQLEDREWITHTHIVLEKLGEVRSNITDAETGERGYLLTGEEAYLAPYNRGVREVRRILNELRQLTSDNPAQQRALDRLEWLVAAKLDFLAERIQIRRRQGLGAAAAAVREGLGKQLMEQINVLLAGMKQEEHRLLMQRSRDLQSSATKSQWTVGLLGAMGFSFILTVGLLIQKEIRKRARVEEQFRSLLEFAPDGMVIVNQKGQIVLVNSQTEKIFGYSRSELLQQSVETLIPQRFGPQHPGHRTQFFGDAKVRPMGAGLELFALRKDGTEFPVEISLAPLQTAEGRLVSCAIRDVTDHKQTRQALVRQAAEVERQREELARSNVELTAANKELESFSYSVSHDLRAPLRSIDGFSVALLEDCADKVDETGKEYLYRVRAATQRMGVLIDDLLDLSRVARVEMRQERVDLSAMAKSILTELASAHPERNASIQIEPRLETIGDSHLLRIVLQNLLGNAWKFTSKRQTPRIEFGKTSSNGTSAYFVRDDGAGFDPAYAARLFGAFQRLHDRSEFPGTGIGLATVQRIVQRHGGRIWAEGALQRGATFYFTLAEASK
jgi:PAS domain S-box-containing protein